MIGLAADNPPPAPKSVPVPREAQLALELAAVQAQNIELREQLVVLQQQLLSFSRQAAKVAVDKAFADVFAAGKVTQKTHRYDPAKGELIPIDQPKE